MMSVNGPGRVFKFTVTTLHSIAIPGEREERLRQVWCGIQRGDFCYEPPFLFRPGFFEHQLFCATIRVSAGCIGGGVASLSPGGQYLCCTNLIPNLEGRRSHHGREELIERFRPRLSVFFPNGCRVHIPTANRLERMFCVAEKITAPLNMHPPLHPG